MREMIREEGALQMGEGEGVGLTILNFFKKIFLSHFFYFWQKNIIRNYFFIFDKKIMSIYISESSIIQVS
jgi:hypothetical protein